MRHRDPDHDGPRLAVRAALKEMGTRIRQTRAPELGWLATPRAAWPDAPYEELPLIARAEQAELGAEPTTRVVEARLLPDEIDRADALFERVRRFPKREAAVLVGFAVNINMGAVSAYRAVKCSRRHAWNILNAACDRLAREGYGLTQK